jgi:tRNA1Val (adenine37-N6)-methyltransferase
MSNHYFQFKQFTVRQERCAMKVSTDACIQGTWTPILPHVRSVLDVGTGTGLLSLMLAQRADNINVDAIEIDEQAAIQAKENIANSVWAQRIPVIQADATSFIFPDKYDMVICNPPFFNDSLLGNKQERNIARHTVSLTHKTLIEIFERTLHSNGYASVLLPYTEHQQWALLLAEKGWHVHQQLHIHHRANSKINRIVSICSKQPIEHSLITPLSIYNNDDTFTPEFTELMRAFYLRM